MRENNGHFERSFVCWCDHWCMEVYRPCGAFSEGILMAADHKLILDVINDFKQVESLLERAIDQDDISDLGEDEFDVCKCYLSDISSARYKLELYISEYRIELATQMFPELWAE